MEESGKNEYIVDGFCLTSKEDAELATQELKTRRYIEKRIEGKGMETIRSVYMGSLEKKMFSTPVGYAFLHDLMERMTALGENPDNIPPIPIFQKFHTTPEEKREKQRTVTVPRKKDVLIIQNTRLKAAVAILVLLVIALFAISFTGSNPTVLNYKYALENEYAQWEQDLKEREAKIRAKEKELNLSGINEGDNADE